MIRTLRQLTTAIAVSLIVALPAQAAESSTVPEANTLSLISLAMAGVLIGRRLSMRNRKD